MIVPEFWAESRIQRRFPDRQVTVRRFGWSDISILLGLLALAVGFVAFLLLLTGLSRAYVRISGGVEQVTLRRVDAFADSHRDWHLRIYRTPNGFRILALHATFDPRSEEVEKAFRSLGVDRTYALMCQKQNCFRARLTAKPWRIGIDERLKPQPGVWPINPSYLPHRNRWVDEYESTAAGYSACHFLKATGAVHVVSRQAEAVCEFHDRICRAHDNLTLA